MEKIDIIQLNNNGNKEFMTADQLIRKLETNGVSFELYPKEKARRYLKKNNNYYKLASYRKNFEKNESGRYIDLDFAYLVDLAIIDMLLRYQIIRLSLDIEHFEKVKLLTFLKANGDNGYTSVASYREHLRTLGERNGKPLLESLNKEINDNQSSIYCHDMIRHLSSIENMPVWVFTEVVTFGTFRRFFEYCANYYNNPKFLDEAYRLKKVKSLRNAAGHSNCVLNNLGLLPYNETKTLNKSVLNKLATTGIVPVELTSSGYIEPDCIQNDRIKEIITLFYVHSRIIPSLEMKAHCKTELEAFVSRMNRNKDAYYKNNAAIINAFEIIQKIIEDWY